MNSICNINPNRQIDASEVSYSAGGGGTVSDALSKIKVGSYQVGRYTFTSNGIQDITVDPTQVTNGKITLDLVCAAATQGIQYLNVVRGDSNKFRIFSSVAQDVTIIALVLCY